ESVFDSHTTQNMLNKALIAVVVLALLAAGAYAAYSRSTINASTATPVPIEAAATPGDRVVAEAKVVPVQRAALSFASGGIVDKLLIHAGDQVQAGQPLAALETMLQQAKRAQAQANLAQAQASHQDLVESVTPQDLAVAEAQFRQSQAQLRTASGSVTPDDLAAATAQLQQSQALLARLTAGAKAT